MITLIGHGYIGTHIAKKLRNFEWISHNETPSKNTSFIINATGYIGYPNVEECEKNKDVCMEANVLYPLSLERQYRIPILHITSGCVYTGYPEGGWTEEDAPNFTFDAGCFYSGCKIAFQKLLQPYLDKSYLFRVRMPFCETPHPKNLLFKYNRYPKLVNYKNTITGMLDLINIVQYFERERPDFGIYNIVNKGIITTEEIVKKLDVDKQWYTREEFESISTTKRSNCALSTKKLESVYPVPHINDSLDKAIFNYRKNCL
jgi:dTDP-4-dehydrorhamnose reductase